MSQASKRATNKRYIFPNHSLLLFPKNVWQDHDGEYGGEALSPTTSVNETKEIGWLHVRVPYHITFISLFRQS
jgi:hypothetical protein